MSGNNTKLNLYNNPKFNDLIPICRFSMNVIDTVKSPLILQPFILSNEGIIQYNHDMDKIFIFRHKKYLTEKSLYFDETWKYYFSNPDGYYHLAFPEIEIMTYPANIYKIQHVSFEGNNAIKSVYDLYTFNLYDLTGIFKDCLNMVSCNLDRFGPSVLQDDSNPKLDYAFANCFSLREAPNCDSHAWEQYTANGNTISMNYALMNTPNILNYNLFNKINFNIRKHGGKGIFLNSNLVQLPKINFSQVYELRNTFDKTTLSGGNSINEYNVDLSSAKNTEAMFKDSGAFMYVIISNNNNLNVANGMFKDNTVITRVTFNNNSNLIEGNALFSGCTNLQEISNSIKFTNSEFVNDVFLNCKSLNTFYDIDLQNAKIASNIYQGCKNIVNINNVTTNGTLYLNNAEVANNIFKDCEYLTNGGNIILSSAKNVYTDGIFEGCSSLNSQVSITNTDKIISSACMYNDCVSLSGVIENNIGNSKNTSAMYKNCNNIISYVENKNQSQISNAKFENCTSLNGGTFYVGNSLFTANMFKKCIKLNDQNINTIENSTCKLSSDVSGMFEGCTEIINTPSIFDSSNAESLVGTFKGCRNLQTVDINLNNAKNANSMVQGCISLTNLNLTIDSSKSFTKFPNIDLRGTNISIDNFVDISSKLPNMSKYIGDGTNYASGLTWNKETNPYTFQEILMGYDTSSTMFISNSFILKPGEYKLRIYRGFNDAVSVIKLGSDGNPSQAMNPFIYTYSFDKTISVFIDEEANYCLYTSSTNNTNNFTSELSLTWYAPYYIIDIRNTPADDITSSSIQTAMTTLNNKGWQVKSNSLVTTLSLFDDTENEPIKSNYLIDIKSVEEGEILQTLDLEYDEDVESEEGTNHNEIFDEPKIMNTEIFEIPAGYYNLYSSSNYSDNIVVYKVTDIGEYPIAMSYENEFILSFEVNERSHIRIKYKTKYCDLVLKKL